MALIITYKGPTKRIVSQAVITSVDGSKSKKVVAMWDTGATISLINDEIAKELQLKQQSITRIRHVAGIADLPSYSAAIEIQGGMKIEEHRFVSSPPIRSFDMIIGMDIITLGNFCIENKNGNTVFSFRY